MIFEAVGPKGIVRGRSGQTPQSARSKALAAYRKKHGPIEKGTVTLREVTSAKGPAKGRAGKGASPKGGSTGRGVKDNPAVPKSRGLTLSGAEEQLLRELRSTSSPTAALRRLADKWGVPIIVVEQPMKFSPAMMKEGTSFVLGADKDGVPNYLEVMPSRSAARATAQGSARRGVAPARALPKRVKYRLASVVDTHPGVFVED